ncbi:MAG: hypothetical protein RLZZ214_3662 [Verrucomicrobiota bacterium]|jgi:hypothetical protein
MKRLFSTILSTLVLTAQSHADELSENFTMPPGSARPWVFSYCDNGNLTSKGITADLEAMKRVGLGGLMFFDVSHGAPASPIDYASPEWHGLVKQLCIEADRIGLQVSINNDAGWSGSGGPWVTPELSMQKLTTSETLVAGGRRFEGALPQPLMLADFYRDVAVLAFPTPAGEDVKMRDQSPKVTSSVADLKADLQQLVAGGPTTQVDLPLPTPDRPVWVQVEFPQPFMARTVLVAAQAEHCWWQLNADGMVQVSDDGQNFRTVSEFRAGPPAPSPGAVPWLQVQLNVEGVTARYFRTVFTKYTPNNLVELKALPLAHIELTSALRLANISGKAAFSAKLGGPPLGATFPKSPVAALVPRGGILDISTKFSADGKLAWDVPPGKWTILRIGHTSTGKMNEPSSKSGKGLECDKLSKAGIEAHFAGLMAKVVANNQSLVGKTLVRTHADSWEGGSQNWTPKFREEFRRLRGYDPLPLLPVVTGRIVDNNEISERFLWDFRQTISDLLIENYAKRFRELCHQHGLQLSLEAYGSVPADDMTYAGQADEPMGEFWSWKKFTCAESCTEMVSAAHVYGRNIIGAEAFTGSNEEKWQSHPGNIKDLGDWAFCEGINRFVFHRSSMQPWGDPAPAPGLSCGPYGLHYDRTQTWWEQSRAWHDYVARCQFMLQRGLFVADLCVLNPEGPQGEVVVSSDVRPNPLDRGAYNFDGCPPDALLTRISVKDGKLILPDGMSYRVLVLPKVETMTPRLLRKIKELVDAGATVVGPAKPPQKSPSLEDYPACDHEVKKLADELWSSGKIVTDMTAAQLLAKRGVPADFKADKHLRYIHRTDADTEIYFVANPKPTAVDALCSFRVTGKQPELWSPDTGRIENAPVFEQKDGVTRVPLRFDPSGSVFVVFRKNAEMTDSVVSVSRDGELLISTTEKVTPVIIQKATYGVPDRTRDVRAQVQALMDSGKRSFAVSEMTKGGDPAIGVVKTLVVEYSTEGNAHIVQGSDPETINMDVKMVVDPTRYVDVHITPDGKLWLEAGKAGNYELKTASGRTLRVEVGAVPQPVEIAGAWEVSFDPKWGGPAAPVKFEKLEDWSKRPEEGIRYYSGTATYRKIFELPNAEPKPKNSRLFLDLGQVAVMAEVKLNGKDLGILWIPPFRVEITDAVRAGENSLELKVVNLWINRQIGDEQLPEDSDRDSSAFLRSWPAWLTEGKPSPTGRYTFANNRLWKKGDALAESGLIGPVKVLTVK